MCKLDNICYQLETDAGLFIENTTMWMDLFAVGERCRNKLTLFYDDKDVYNVRRGDCAVLLYIRILR